MVYPFFCGIRCFSKVVGEVASLVSIDEATEYWENLEYTRLQVCLLKSCNGRLSKGMRINGQVYNICIEKDIPRKVGSICKCTYNHYASFDSISSLDSFVEEVERFQIAWTSLLVVVEASNATHVRSIVSEA